MSGEYVCPCCNQAVEQDDWVISFIFNEFLCQDCYKKKAIEEYSATEIAERFGDCRKRAWTVAEEEEKHYAATFSS